METKENKTTEGNYNGLTEEEFLKKSWTFFYDDMVYTMYIMPQKCLLDMLDYFITKNDDEKCKYITSLLNKYYKGSLENVITELINEEKYEMCSFYKKYLI